MNGVTFYEFIFCWFVGIPTIGISVLTIIRTVGYCLEIKNIGKHDISVLILSVITLTFGIYLLHFIV